MAGDINLEGCVNDVIAVTAMEPAWTFRDKTMRVYLIICLDFAVEYSTYIISSQLHIN